MTRSGSLIRDWRLASYSSTWTHSEQWWTPAVDAVAEALVGLVGAVGTVGAVNIAGVGGVATDIGDIGVPGDARAACENLGRQRAAAGVFLDEARADVMIAARVAGLGPASTTELVDRLTVGWVDRTLDRFFTSACIDPVTELASLPYLMTRLGEVYADAAARGVDISDEQAFVVVQILIVADLLDSEMQMVLTQRALRRAFGSGETLARVGPQCAIALVSRSEPQLSYALGRLRSELESARATDRLRRTRMWLERLPRDRDSLPAVIRQLND